MGFNENEEQSNKKHLDSSPKIGKSKTIPLVTPNFKANKFAFEDENAKDNDALKLPHSRTYLSNLYTWL
jgi:hypothetical protein